MSDRGTSSCQPAFRSEPMVRDIASVYEQLLEANRERVHRFEVQRDGGSGGRPRTRLVSSVRTPARSVGAAQND